VRKTDVILIIVAAAVLAAYMLYMGPLYRDDTFISFRYARNLVAGHGLVYNVGERVEGYTNFLWTMFAAAAIAAGHKPETAALAAARLAALVSVALTYVVARRHLGAPRFFAFAGAALVAANGSFASEAEGAMETALFAALIVGGVLLALDEDARPRRIYWSSVVWAAAALTRPEGVMVFVLVSGYRLAWPAPAHRGRRRALAARLVAPFVLIYAPYYVWRFAYYGYPFPNTFYAKVGASWATVGRGLDYVGRFAWKFTPVLFALPLLGLADGARRRNYGLLIVVAYAYLLYVVAVGGDYLEQERFVIYIFPLLATAGAAAAGWLGRRRRGRRVLRWAAPAAFAFLLLLQTRAFFVRPRGLAHARDTISQHRAAGLWLKSTAAPDDVLVIGPAGIVPYYAELRTYDTIGIVVPAIAHEEVAGMGTGMAGHEKGDGAVLLAKNPRYILIVDTFLRELPLSLPTVRGLARYKGDVEMLNDATFDVRYQLKHQRLSEKCWLNYFERRAAPTPRR